MALRCAKKSIGSFIILTAMVITYFSLSHTNSSIKTDRTEHPEFNWLLYCNNCSNFVTNSTFHIQFQSTTTGTTANHTTSTTTQEKTTTASSASNISYNLMGCFNDWRHSDMKNQWTNSIEVKTQQNCAQWCFSKTAFALYKSDLKRCLCQNYYGSDWVEDGHCEGKDAKNYEVMYFGNVTGILAKSYPSLGCRCTNNDCVALTCTSVKCWVGPTLDDLKRFELKGNSCSANDYSILPYRDTVKKKYCMSMDSLHGFWPKITCQKNGRLISENRLYRIISTGPVQVQMTPRDDQKRIILLSLYRSGSTLTSELFASNDQTLYIYEPLRFVKGGLETINDHKDDIKTLEHVKALYSCHLFRFPVDSFNVHTLVEQIFKHCNNRKTDTVHECLAIYWTRCVLKPMISIKFIRLSAHFVTEIIKLPHVKVLGLLRDPRAMIKSRSLLDKKNLNSQAPDLCQWQMEITKLVKELSKTHQNQLALLHMEDLILHTDEAVNYVYKGLDLGKAPDSVLKGINNLTHGIRKGGKLANGPANYNTFRSNSFLAAFGWKTEMNHTDVQLIDSSCKEAYHYTGYQTVQSTAQLKNMSLLHRTSPFDT